MRRRRRDRSAATGERGELATNSSAPNSLNAEVKRRFGVLPNFFMLAPDTPEISSALWNFARFAYLDNPLSSVFKERLFVYLSRFCDVRYCVARHLGFLVGLGHPAGDEHAPVHTVDEALRLLRRRSPGDDPVELQVERLLAGGESATSLPPADSELEEAMFSCAAHVFLQSAEAPQCVMALKRALGASKFEYLMVFLAFVRTAHYWTQVHAELTLEKDVDQLLETHEVLAESLLTDPAAAASELSGKLLAELDALREDKQQRAALAKALGAASASNDRLGRGNAALAEHAAEALDARRAALNMMEDAIEARDALRESQQRLLDADRRKDEFLATLAHELRNPLAPIRNSVRIMAFPGIEPDVAEQARDTIERQVTHLVRLVDDLLDVSRISQNKLELRKDRVALAVVLQSAIETSRPVIEEAGHELIVRLPSQTLWINADLTRLAQALANLLNNAAKYTPRDGSIRLTAERHDREAIVRVRDSGIGIPQHMLPHVFEMFRQVDASQERSHGGLGIGLTLVKDLVEMHGGTVEARSDGMGQGSEFLLRLPLATDKQKAASGDLDGKLATPVTSRRILIIDDNRDSVDSLAMLLAHAGHDVSTCYDGLEGIEAAKSLEPDVILLDIGMPKLNGFDVARRIRQETWGEHIVLVALTGWGQEEVRAQCRAAGFDAHMVKPVELPALAELLAGPLSRSNAQGNSFN